MKALDDQQPTSDCYNLFLKKIAEDIPFDATSEISEHNIVNFCVLSRSFKEKCDITSLEAAYYFFVVNACQAKAYNLAMTLITSAVALQLKNINTLLLTLSATLESDQGKSIPPMDKLSMFIAIYSIAEEEIIELPLNIDYLLTLIEFPRHEKGQIKYFEYLNEIILLSKNDIDIIQKLLVPFVSGMRFLKYLNTQKKIKLY